ncbi:SpoIIE family protein phosphatase [Streptomyces sp. NPDC058086]|uniref:SpoIIE family protein phosphatase n=1 Tax=Streptomyces sp. NPDC058086 TaxID=3346334 RepID=UPI0036E7ADCC
MNASGATATVLITPSGTVAGWSQGAQSLLGWTADEAVSRSADELFGVGFSRALGWVLGKELNPVRLTVHAKNGTVVNAELTAHPCEDRGGRPLGAFLTAAEGVGSRQDQADSEIVRRAMEQAPFLCVIFDLDLLGLWTNTVTAESGNLKQVDELRGHPLDDAPLSRAMIESLNARMREVRRTGEPSYLFITERLQAEEQAHPWAVRFWPVRDDDGDLCAIAYWGVDVTAEYEARQRLLLLSEGTSAIGRTLDVEDTARELAEALVPGFADSAAVDLFAGVFSGEEPPPVPASGTVRLRRAAQAPVTGTRPTGAALEAADVTTIAPGSAVEACLASGEPQVHLASDTGPRHRYAAGPQLATERACWPPGLPVISAQIREEEGIHSQIVVPLQARGALLGVAQFSRAAIPEPFTADDLVLATDVAANAAIAIDNSRRYTRERATALTLQRSLLPQALPEQAAVEVATRYLPASQTGVGGDWFDVIPLSGSRVALVVGDVVGHGIHAAASMGRLRIAVRTLAAVDLPPDELLTHLDDLVIQITHSAGEGTTDVDRSNVADLGATCLYAVYDPVTSHCAMAPLPAIRCPSSSHLVAP